MKQTYAALPPWACDESRVDRCDTSMCSGTNSATGAAARRPHPHVRPLGTTVGTRVEHSRVCESDRFDLAKAERVGVLLRRVTASRTARVRTLARSFSRRFAVSAHLTSDRLKPSISAMC